MTPNAEELQNIYHNEIETLWGLCENANLPVLDFESYDAMLRVSRLATDRGVFVTVVTSPSAHLCADMMVFEDGSRDFAVSSQEFAVIAAYYANLWDLLAMRVARKGV